MEALQAQVTAMQGERDQAVQGPVVKLQAVGHIPSRNNGVIPPMPTLVPAELDNWMHDLQVDLQNAMNLGDHVAWWKSVPNWPKVHPRWFT